LKKAQKKIAKKTSIKKKRPDPLEKAFRLYEIPKEKLRVDNAIEEFIDNAGKKDILEKFVSALLRHRFMTQRQVDVMSRRADLFNEGCESFAMIAKELQISVTTVAQLEISGSANFIKHYKKVYREVGDVLALERIERARRVR
jgi:hypothetical protein